MQIETYEMQIGGQENPHLNSNIANAIGTCNLIIDATANSHTFLTLAAIAKENIYQWYGVKSLVAVVEQ